MAKPSKSTKRYNLKHKDLPKRKSLTKIINKRNQAKLNKRKPKEEKGIDELGFENINDSSERKRDDADIDYELDPVSEENESNASTEESSSTEEEDLVSDDSNVADQISQSEGEDYDFNEELKKVKEMDKEYSKYYQELKPETCEEIQGMFVEDEAIQILERIKECKTLSEIKKDEIDKFEGCLQFVIEKLGSKDAGKKDTEPKLYVQNYQIAKSYILDLISIINNMETSEESDESDTHKTVFMAILEIYSYSTDKELIVKTMELTKPFLDKFELKNSDYKKLTDKILKHYVMAFKNFESKVLLSGIIKYLIDKNQHLAQKIYKSLYKKFLEYSNKKAPTIRAKKIKLILEGLLAYLKMSDTNAFIFVFQTIRKLGSLISAMTKTNDKHTEIYNWQFINTVKLITQFICESCRSDVAPSKAYMRELIYPFVELMMGVCFLVNQQRYIPFKMMIIHSLNDIMKSTKTFIPIPGVLLMILETKIINDLFYRTHNVFTLDQYKKTIVLSDDELKCFAVFNIVIEDFNIAFLTFLRNICTSISFPEITLPLHSYLKAHIKNTKFYSREFNDMLEKLLEEIVANSNLIKAKREKLVFKDSTNIAELSNDIIDIEESPIYIYYSKLTIFSSKKQECLKQNQRRVK